MTFKAKEDRPTPPEVYNFRVYLVTFLASLGGTMFGYDFGYIGSTLFLPSFGREFGFDKLTIDQLNAVSSNTISVFQGGCFFGSMFAPVFSERFGRRKPIIGATALFLLGGFLQIWADGNLDLMYVGRVLNGLGSSMASCLIITYIAEYSPPAIRGRLVGMCDVMFWAACSIGFWINYGMQLHFPASSNKQWRIPVAVQVIPAGLLLISMFFVWESPRWLAQRDRPEETLATLSRIRQLPLDHPYILKELDDINAQIAREREVNNDAIFWGPLKEFMGRGYRNRLGISIGLMIFHALTGIVAIAYYAPTIFRSLGLSGTSTALLATGVFGMVELVSCAVFFMWIVDRVGRRKSLLVGSLGISASMLYIGAYAAIAKPNPMGAKQTAAGWVAAAAIYIFAVFYCTSWGGLSLIIPSEILPLRLRTLGLTIASMTLWGFSFIITKFTPYMLTSMGFGTYFFFGASMPVAFLWTYFIVPETSGRTLEEMDVLFGVPAAVREKEKEVAGRATRSGSESTAEQVSKVKEDV